MGDGRVARLTVAHLRLARMYQELGQLCAKCGDPERARRHREKAEAHLSKARSRRV